MATKRFDDATEKARAMEAKAKKLRREAQAARTKAYADALVTVFPEVKDMGSAEEVLDFVKGLKPGTGHGTPVAHAAGAADSAYAQTAEAGESSEAHGAFPARATRGSRAGFHRRIRVPCRTGEVVPVSDMGKPISVDKRRGFEGDGAAAPSQADEVGQIANFAICTYEVNACSFPLCARALRN